MSTEVIPLFSSPLYVSVDGEMPEVGKELQEIECGREWDWDSVTRN